MKIFIIVLPVVVSVSIAFLLAVSAVSAGTKLISAIACALIIWYITQAVSAAIRKFRGR
jgi:hypothetical protein